MIRLFTASAITRAANFDEIVVFMFVSKVTVIDPYLHNTARAVPVAKTFRKGSFGR
jgi:hypothetical protein